MISNQEILTFLTGATKGLCTSPDQVSIQAIESGGKLLCYVISCAPTDIALVIGRQGRNIKALRDIAWAIAAKHGFKANIIVSE